MKTIEIFLKGHKIIKAIVSNGTDINLARIKRYDVLNIHGAKNCSFNADLIEMIDVVKQDDNEYCKDISEIAFTNINEQIQEENKPMKDMQSNVEDDELILKPLHKSRLIKMDDDIPDDNKEYKDIMNEMGNHLAQLRAQQLMNSFRPNLNLPFIKR
jgi:hypothetical protein